jgi:hypothetical protein
MQREPNKVACPPSHLQREPNKVACPPSHLQDAAAGTKFTLSVNDPNSVAVWTTDAPNDASTPLLGDGSGSYSWTVGQSGSAKPPATLQVGAIGGSTDVRNIVFSVGEVDPSGATDPPSTQPAEAKPLLAILQTPPPPPAATAQDRAEADKLLALADSDTPKVREGAVTALTNLVNRVPDLVNYLQNLKDLTAQQGQTVDDIIYAYMVREQPFVVTLDKNAGPTTLHIKTTEPGSFEAVSVRFFLDVADPSIAKVGFLHVPAGWDGSEIQYDPPFPVTLDADLQPVVPLKPGTTTLTIVEEFYRTPGADGTDRPLGHQRLMDFTLTVSEAQ